MVHLEDKKDEDDEILCRLIHWNAIPTDGYCGYYTAESSHEDDDKTTYYPGGFITYYIYNVPLYDKIFKYFNIIDLTPSRS